MKTKGKAIINLLKAAIKESEPLKIKNHVGIVTIVEKTIALVLYHLEINQDHSKNEFLIPYIE